MTTTETVAPDITESLKAEARAKRLFVEFVDFVKIEEPPQIAVPGSGGIIPFLKWPHLMELAVAFVTHTLIAVLKARQLGVSWLFAAYALWLASYHKGAVVLMLSKGQDEAIVLLSKVRAIHRHLSPGMQVPIGSDRRQLITFPTMASKILALPSTENAGRSETATTVISDEADFHEYLDANYAAIKPTIDAGGQLIFGSTSNKLKMRSLFKALIKGAPKNGWVKFFFGWRTRVGRDEQWYQLTRLAVPETLHVSPAQYMEQEYPDTEAEALAPSRVLGAFDRDALLWMQTQTRRPLPRVEGQPKSANIYEPWSMRNKYVAFTDTSHGVMGDYSVTTITDVKSGHVAADIMSNLIGPEDLAYDSIELLRMYPKTVWAIEDNEWGVLTIVKANELEYKYLFVDPDNPNVRPGTWHTGQASRFVLWGECVQAVNDYQITVFSEEGLNQFFAVIRNPDKGGRIEGTEGDNDDYPFSVAGCIQLRKLVQISTGRGTAKPPGW